MAQPQFYFKNSKSVLQNLSDSKIELVIHLYKCKESVERIKQRVGIKTELKQASLYKQLPYERSSDKCHCGNALYYKVSSNTIQPKRLFTCLSCGHYEAAWCQCDACAKTRNLRREEGMREFTICMMDFLFPDEKLYTDDPFDAPKI